MRRLVLTLSMVLLGCFAHEWKAKATALTGSDTSATGKHRASANSAQLGQLPKLCSLNCGNRDHLLCHWPVPATP